MNIMNFIKQIENPSFILCQLDRPRLFDVNQVRKISQKVYHYYSGSMTELSSGFRIGLVGESTIDLPGSKYSFREVTISPDGDIELAGGYELSLFSNRCLVYLLSLTNTEQYMMVLKFIDLSSIDFADIFYTVSFLGFFQQIHLLVENGLDIMSSNQVSSSFISSSYP